MTRLILGGLAVLLLAGRLVAAAPSLPLDTVVTSLTWDDFTNATSGGTFSFSQSIDQRSLLLNFTPVPEPSTWLMLGTGAGLVAFRLRRRRT